MDKQKEIQKYIQLRFQNWLDYAKYQATKNGCSDWAEDLLNEVLLNLLQKPVEKNYSLLTAKTKKEINGQKTTELDKFILRMIEINASSPVAPFRKNILGKKIINRTGKKVETIKNVEVDNLSIADDGYDGITALKMDKMHRKNIIRLKQLQCDETTLDIYQKHFISGQKIKDSEKWIIERIEKILIPRTNGKIK